MPSAEIANGYAILVKQTKGEFLMKCLHVASDFKMEIKLQASNSNKHLETSNYVVVHFVKSHPFLNHRISLLTPQS